MIKKIYGFDHDYKDFVKVFKLFEYEPFWEKWDEHQVKEVFDNFYKNGEVFGNYYYYSSTIMGIMTLLYGADPSHPVKFDNPSKVAYLSNIAVLPEYRNKCVGTELISFAVNVLGNLGYKYLYTRTNCVGSMLDGILLKQGFEVMKDSNKQIITQNVYFPRTKEDISETDVRKFLVKRLINI